MNIWTCPWRRSRDGRALALRRRCNLSLEALEDRCLLSASFTQINLDSDVPGLARVTDPYMINPWGIAFSPTGAFWFGENGIWASDVVDGNGQLLPVVVTVPGAPGDVGTPTGVAYNGGSGFQITQNGVSGPAHFLFASEDGTIAAWNPQVNDSTALVMINNSSQGADYKGLAVATGTDGKSYLYAADFGRGEIDVFDENFNQVSTAGSFSDPNIPAGFAPFNVQNINGQLYVTYAKQESGGDDDVAGAGNGFIDIYSPSGTLVERLASGGPLNSPWGMAVAPQSFGSFAGALLVGNNGDGHILAYDLGSGAYLGQLTDTNGNPLAIDGLWGLTVGNDHLAGNSQTLFFAAGISGEHHGLFGAIQNTQGGQSGTSGTLPYDPNSDNDDYPLPPARGPALGGDSGPPAPTPVLLSASNSSLALAPTLSLTSGALQSLTVDPFVPVLSLAGPQDSANPVVVIGTITGSGGLTAFSLTSPMELISSDLPAAETARFGMDEVDAAVPVALMFLEQYPSADFAAMEEGTFLLSAQADSEPSELPGSVREDVRMETKVEPITVPSSEGSHLKESNLQSILEQPSSPFAEPPVLAAANNSTDTPFHAYVIRGLFLAVATCLPWNYYGTGKGWGRKLFRLK